MPCIDRSMEFKGWILALVVSPQEQEIVYSSHVFSGA